MKKTDIHRVGRMIAANRRCAILRRFLFGIAFLLGAVALPPRLALAEWQVECIDCDVPRAFSDFTPNAAAIDPQGRPHLVYGRNNLYHAFIDNGEWVIETVDSHPGVGAGAAIAIDRDGGVHIAYPDNSRGENDGEQKAVKYATNASGMWIIESIPVEVAWWGQVTFTSIAVDSQRKAHIAYFSNYPPERLDYVTNVTGPWIVQTVERSDQTGQYNDIAVDADGYVHISYMSYANPSASALKYATNRTGGWVISTVQDNLPRPGSLQTRFTSLALDSSNVPHIAYIAGEARYATIASGAWSIETIEGPITWDSYPSLARDSAGILHLAFMGASGIRYARRDAMDWNIADGPPGNYRILALAVDSVGVAHLGSLFSTSSGFDVNRIEYSCNAGGIWNTSVIDVPAPGRDAGKTPQVAVDAEGAVYLTYLDATNQTIKRADEKDGVWAISDLFGNAAASSPVIDDAGVYRFSFEDRMASPPALRYVVGTPGSWTSSVLAQAALSSWPDQAIAQDGNGAIHAAFCREFTLSRTRSLVYGTNAGGIWTTKELGSGRYGCGLSLAVDSAGTVHLLSHLGESSAMPPLVEYWTNASDTFQPISFGRGYEGALALDQSGALHVAYIKAERAIPGTGIVSYYRDLAYATNASGAWVMEDVDLALSGNAPLGAPSIALDAAGRIHIAYGDANTLKHAVRENNVWTTEVADESVGAGQSSIAVGSDGGIHIAYYDGAWGDLRYAFSPGAGVCTYYHDGDGDGYGSATDALYTDCGSVPDGYSEQAGDCNDSDPATYARTLWYKDVDGDGYSDGTSTLQCEQPKDYIRSSEALAASGDCNDDAAAINPATAWYKDVDGDGYSDGIARVQCSRPDGYFLASELVMTMGDCNDGDGGLNPTNPAACSAVKSADASDLDADGVGDGRDAETFLQGEVLLEAGEYVFNRLVLEGGTRLALRPNASSNRITIHASEIMISADATLSAFGYPSDSGPGAGSSSTENGGGGAGHGGKGGDAGGAGGSAYGLPAEPAEPGSGGGSGADVGAAGGGALWFVVDGEFHNDGFVSAEGGDSGGDGGGGSGGSIYVLANTITGNGSFSANGGDSIAGGGGAGGRMALYADTDAFEGTLTADAGIGVHSGEPGTLVRGAAAIASAASMQATAVSSDTILSETVLHRKLALHRAIVSGALSGQVSFTQMDAFVISTGAFAGKEIWRGTWTAILSGTIYTGEWKGLAFSKDSEHRVQLKAALSGGILGIVEGFLTETTAGSGVFDQIEMKWTAARLGDASTSAILKIAGTLSAVPVAAFENVELNALQVTVQGSSIGDYAGALQTVLTGVRFLSSDIACYGEGFAFLSYVSSKGSGEAWAYMQRVGNEEYALAGVSDAPMKGRLTGTLYESGWPEPRILLLNVERLDWALPALPDLKIATWGPGMMSSGQTEDYIIEYRNDGNANAEDVVVVDRLPHISEHLGNSPGGVYRWDTHEVIWKLGTVPPRTRRYLSVRIRVPFGTELGSELQNTAAIASTTATVAAYRNANVVSPFDIQEYLAYEPTTIQSTRALTVDDIAAFRADAAAEDLYRYALELGYIDSGVGFEDTTASGAVLTHLIFLHQDKQAGALALVKVADSTTEAAYLIEADGDTVYIFEREGGLSYNILHNEQSADAINYWGSWSPHSPSRTSCTVNCMVSKIPGLAVDYFGGKFIKALSAVAGELWSIKAYANAGTCMIGCREGCLNNSTAGMASGVEKCSSRCGKDSACYRACLEEEIPEPGIFDLFTDASVSCGLSCYSQCRPEWESAGKTALKNATKLTKQIPIVDVLYALGSCHRDCILDVGNHACEPGAYKYKCASPWQKLWMGGDVMGYKCDENYVWGGIWGAPPDTWNESCPKGTTCRDVNPYATSKEELCKPDEDVPEKDAAPIVTTTGHDPNYKARIDFDSQETLPAGECAMAGDWLKYRVEFENEGAGIAFGVYVTDVLDPRLEPLEIGPMLRVCKPEDGACVPEEQISDGGVFDPSTRTISWMLWNEGRVNPMQGGYAIVTVQIASDAPDGEEIANHATVYFASVPEVTHTNAVVTRVGPKPVWYRDEDGDGFGDAGISVETCSPPEKYVDNGDDCDDGDSTVHPSTVWFADQDADGYSDGSTESACERPAGYRSDEELTAAYGDCNDAHSGMNPGSPEVCGDGIDNDCDGNVDEDCPVPVTVSGGAYFFPETATYRATFSLNVPEASYATGWLKYYYVRTRMNFVSTTIATFSLSGKTVTISGTGSVNGIAGYTFVATVTDGSPDAFRFAIYKSNGAVYYSAGPKNISGGDLIIQ